MPYRPTVEVSVVCASQKGKRAGGTEAPLSCCLGLPPPESSTNCEVRCAAPLPSSGPPGKERAGGGSPGTSLGLGPCEHRARTVTTGGVGESVPDRPLREDSRGRHLPPTRPRLRWRSVGRRGGGNCGAGRGAATPVLPGQSRSRRLRPLVAVVLARLARPRGAGTRRRRRPSRPASHGPARRGGAVRARDCGADPRRHPGGRGRRGAGGRGGGGGGGGAGLGGPLSVPQPRLGQRQRGGAEPRAQVSAAAGPWPRWESPTPSPGRTPLGGAQLRGHSGSSPPHSPPAP